MSEVAPAGGGPNKMFIVIALGLVGLLIIGVVVVVGILFFQSQARPTPVAVGTPTRAGTAIVLVTTPTRPALVVFTPTVSATDTPVSTPTLVVQPQSGGATPAISSTTLTATVAVTGTVAAGTPGSGMPQTGIGEDLLMLAGGIVLVFVIIAARRARSSAAV